MVNVDAPLTNGCVRGVPPSTLSDTLPVGVPAMEESVTVTMPLAL